MKLLKKSLKLLNFDSINFDFNVFVFKNKKIYIVVYVNDLFIFCIDLKFIVFLKIKLNEKFDIIDLSSTKHYLNIEIVRKKTYFFVKFFI